MSLPPPGLEMHVIPRADLVEHEADEDCACGPSPDPVKREDGSIGWVYVHHALDRRETRQGEIS